MNTFVNWICSTMICETQSISRSMITSHLNVSWYLYVEYIYWIQVFWIFWCRKYWYYYDTSPILHRMTNCIQVQKQNIVDVKFLLCCNRTIYSQHMITQLYVNDDILDYTNYRTNDLFASYMTKINQDITNYILYSLLPQHILLCTIMRCRHSRYIVNSELLIY